MTNPLTFFWDRKSKMAPTKYESPELLVPNPAELILPRPAFRKDPSTLAGGKTPTKTALFTCFFLYFSGPVFGVPRSTSDGLPKPRSSEAAPGDNGKPAPLAKGAPALIPQAPQMRHPTKITHHKHCFTYFYVGWSRIIKYVRIRVLVASRTYLMLKLRVLCPARHMITAGTEPPYAEPCTHACPHSPCRCLKP